MIKITPPAKIAMDCLACKKKRGPLKAVSEEEEPTISSSIHYIIVLILGYL
jgi:hypothetical protein